MVGQALSGTSFGALAFEDGCGSRTIGGTILNIDSYSLVLAGIQSLTVWMIPALAGLVVVGVYLTQIRAKKKN